MEKDIKNKGKKREIKGTVVGNKMQSTARVRVDSVEAHPVYRKTVNRKKVFFAHSNEPLNIGDVVTIRESKPFSKNVRWVVISKEA